MSNTPVDAPFSRMLSDMRNSLVEGLKPAPAIGRHESLDEHLEMIKNEFVGRPKLLYYHSELVVRIRRALELDENLKTYWLLWDAELEFLLDKLDTRWLVAACDTIADHHPDPAERATALSAAILINTIKLYETERVHLGNERLTKSDAYPPQPLFDGLTTFAVGAGDMIANLTRRIATVAKLSPLAGAILLELFSRMHRQDTVFARMAAVHANDATRWTP